MPSFRSLPLVLAASIVLPGAARAAEIRWVEAQSAITIEGQIIAGDDAKFAALMAHRPHNLVIRSDGGRQVPALAIAKQVREHEMTVIVDAFCASACAQIIFPAAAERRIRPDSFVAFHGGNLAALQAVRAAVVRDMAALPAPDAPASDASADAPIPAASQAASQAPADAESQADARRATIAATLATFESRLDTIDTAQAAFDAEMKLDPQVVDFYLRLTAPRDIKVELHPGEPEPVRVAVGRRGICDWWVPDREGLARLGLTLRNAYEVPPVVAIATMAHTTPARLYLGPPIPVDDPRFDTLCPQR